MLHILEKVNRKPGITSEQVRAHHSFCCKGDVLGPVGIPYVRRNTSKMFLREERGMLGGKRDQMCPLICMLWDYSTFPSQSENKVFKMRC